ncbi:hypothetical protein O1L55_18970 [Streptomyces albulus]|nr:hypothetical protein [Streptomyces noursei]
MTPAAAPVKPFVPAARTAPGTARRRRSADGTRCRRCRRPSSSASAPRRTGLPTSRVRRTAGALPLSTGPFGDPAHLDTAAAAPAIPAARRRERSTAHAV